MSSDEIFEIYGVKISSSKKLSYGSQLTIIKQPIKMGDFWTTMALETPETQIHIDKELEIGERLIIIKNNGMKESLFGYIGMPVNKLEEASDEVTRTFTEQAIPV